MEFPKFKNEYHYKGHELLPHRSPFLFVDELVSADETGALGYYTYSEEKNDFFKGHFPGHPVVPGVVLIESMAQVAGAALVATNIVTKGPNGEPPLFFLATVDNVKFRHPVGPGDTLTTVSTNLLMKTKIGKFAMKGYVGDTLVAEATVTCILSSGTRS